MNVTKIFGWILLVVGLAIIGWTLISSYDVFTGKAVVPEIFELPKEETQAPTGKITGIEDIQLEQMIGEQLKEILPVDTLPRLLNLITWSILAIILISGGAKISNVGIKLIKK